MTIKGELYRIATVLNYEEKKNTIGGKCPLFGTFFKAFSFEPNSKRPLVLKVLVFSCSSAEEREMFQF